MRKLLSFAWTMILLCSMVVPAFAAPEPKTAKSMLELVNAAREKEGLNALEWDKDLEEAALLRAKESAEKYSQDHIRPNGQKLFSASTKIWAENIAWGQKSAEEAMATWLASRGHRANILDERMTIFAAAYAWGDNGVVYWTQDFGTGASNYTWAMKDFGVKNFTLDPFDNPATPRDKAGASAQSAELVNKNGNLTGPGLSAALKKALATSSGEAVVRIKNAKSVSAAALKSFASTTGSRTGKIQADTMTSTGESVQGRLLLEPAKLTGRKTAVKLGVYVDSASIAAIKGIAESNFSNVMAYIHMEHQGTLTIPTRVSAQVELTGLDPKNLQIYVYNKKEVSLTLLKNTDYIVDSNGLLHFTTRIAGDIVISDNALKAKE